MTYTFPELKHKNLVELKEIAASIDPPVQGYTQMNKDHILVAICQALNIDMKAHHEVVGIDKSAVKQKIRDWQKKRDDALAARDRKSLRVALNHIHNFKHRLRKSMI